MRNALTRFSKAIAALLAGVAVSGGAVTLTDAPAWLLVVVPLVNALAVGFAPRNADPTTARSYPPAARNP